jgi:hypothetical protein
VNLKHNEVEFYNTVKFGNFTDIKEALNDLNRQINELERKVTFWDVYNITQTITSESEFLSKTPLLSAGEAAIINVNMIKVADKYYYRGDIIYRQVDNTLLHIPAENSGIYVPSLSIVNGKLQVTYTYSPSVVDDGTEVFSFNVSGKDFGYCDVKSVTTFTDGTDYATWSKSMIQVSGSSQYLYPSIKFYLQIDNGVFEEIFPNFFFTISGGNAIISIPQSLKDLCDDNIITNVWVRLR